MCGIVGLFLKDKSLEANLGQMLSEMLVTMTDRGPDSAGIAVYDAHQAGQVKITVQADDPQTDFDGLDKKLGAAIGASLQMNVRDTHAVLTMPQASLDSAMTE
ncbi:MAG: glutamine amidotransferase, partial [Candidatus Puniceispirillaceae bacterium]